MLGHFEAKVCAMKSCRGEIPELASVNSIQLFSYSVVDIKSSSISVKFVDRSLESLCPFPMIRLLKLHECPKDMYKEESS